MKEKNHTFCGNWESQSYRGALDSQNYIYYIILVQTKKTLFNILPHKTEKGEQSKQGEQQKGLLQLNKKKTKNKKKINKNKKKEREPESLPNVVQGPGLRQQRMI